MTKTLKYEVEEEEKNLFGVPCSGLGNRAEDVEINCTSEEEAMALAVGVWLAGKEAVVYMQNSGLCRCLDIVMSLYKPYDIPLPKLILSIRHAPLQVLSSYDVPPRRQQAPAAASSARSS